MAELEHELPPLVFSGSYTTIKYTDKQDVGLLSLPEKGTSVPVTESFSAGPCDWH
jgi:hypothetical protein